MAVLSVVLSVVMAALPPAARGAEPAPDARLKEVEKALAAEKERQQRLEREAAEIEETINHLQQEMVAAAGRVQHHETEVSDIEERLSELTAIEEEKRQRLASRRNQFGRVLMALERLAGNPPEAVIAQPVSPADTVRSAILLRAVVPAIENRARILRSDLATIAAARREIDERRLALAAANDGLDGERGRLDRLLQRQNELHRQTRVEGDAAAAHVRELAAKASDLRELLANLMRPTPPPEAALPAKGAPVPAPSRPTRAGQIRPISKARGALLYPVAGPVAARYGETTGTGLTRKGIEIETRPDAQVIAPYDGQVVYAGPFRGYGELLIIEHSEGYHSLLAGLARIDCIVGQGLVAGEPVGIMGRPKSGKPALYVELRRNSQPINPLPWLAARKGKGNG